MISDSTCRAPRELSAVSQRYRDLNGVLYLMIVPYQLSRYPILLRGGSINFDVMVSVKTRCDCNVMTLLHSIMSMSSGSRSGPVTQKRGAYALQ